MMHLRHVTCTTSSRLSRRLRRDFNLSVVEVWYLNQQVWTLRSRLKDVYYIYRISTCSKNIIVNTQVLEAAFSLIYLL